MRSAWGLALPLLLLPAAVRAASPAHERIAILTTDVDKVDPAMARRVSTRLVRLTRAKLTWHVIDPVEAQATLDAAGRPASCGEQKDESCYRAVGTVVAAELVVQSALARQGDGISLQVGIFFKAARGKLGDVITGPDLESVLGKLEVLFPAWLSQASVGAIHARPAPLPQRAHNRVRNPEVESPELIRAR